MGVVYTCPMHPDVRQPGPGKCPKCGMTLVPAKGDTAAAVPWTRSWLVVAVLVAIAGFYLWTEHRAHLLGALPYLVFLAGPLACAFMPHGHGAHGGGHGPEDHSGHRQQ